MKMLSEHETEQLLRAFAGLAGSQPIFYEKIVSHFADMRNDRLESLVEASSDTSIFRAQGYCSALKEVLELMQDPHKQLRDFEER